MSARLLERLVPRIQVSDTFGTWADAPELRLDSRVQLVIGSAVTDQITLRHLYGPAVKLAHERQVHKVDPLPYAHRWVRVVDPDDSENVLWQGIIKRDQRAVFPSSEGPHGVQTFVAIGGVEILRRCIVNTSWWWDSDGALRELEWIPHLNRRGIAGLLEGTRTDNEHPPYGYLFGGTSTWTHAQFLEHLLIHHIQQIDGPGWTLSGATDILEDHTEAVALGQNMNALEILHRFIKPAQGLEFAVLPTAIGFAIKVFAISAAPVTFGNVTMPANGDTLPLSPSTDPYVINADVEDSYDQVVDTLEVSGERIESCFTIAADEKEAMWTSAQESAYKSASTKGGADELDHDLARTDDSFRLVYQGFRLSDDFDHNDGAASPILDDEGELDSVGAYRQNIIRRTLPRLPLFEGGDYTTDPPTLTAAQDDFVPTLAVGKVSADRGYVVLDKTDHADLEGNDDIIVHGASVRVCPDDWAVLLEFRANYMHAKNHWAAGSPSASWLDPDTECIDYDDTVITIAVPTDQRLRVWKVNDVVKLDGSKAVIRQAGARLQYLAPETVIGVDTDGTLKKSPSGTSGVVLRNDNTKLHAIMAGAIQRYLEPRFAVDITYKGQWPVPANLGQIIVMDRAEGDIAGRWALVTHIWWDFESGTSGIRAGYA